MNEKKQFFILSAVVVLNLWVAFNYMFFMPSYTSIVDDIEKLDGRILADNPNIVHLIKNTDLNDDYVYNFFYFDFDNDGGSTKNDYEEAIKNNFFDYILIPSELDSSEPYTIASETSELWQSVPEYYCEYKTSKGLRLGITIFRKCASK